MPELTLAAQTRRPRVAVIEVELADGQIWGFARPGPMPYPILRRELDAFGRDLFKIEQETRVGYTLAVRRLKTELIISSRDGGDGPSGELFRRLAVALLRMAHDVEPEMAEALLEPRDVDLAEIARRIIPAVFEGPEELYASSGR